MAAKGFDVPRLIERFGGRSRLFERLRKRGHNVTIKMIEKWRERGRIPDRWLAEMIDMARAERKPLDLNKFLAKPPATEAATDDVLA